MTEILSRYFKSDLLQMLLSAGPMVKLVLLLLLALSVISWAIIFTKYRQFKRASKESRRFLDIFWRSKNLQAAFMEARPFRHSHLARVFRQAYLELGKLSKAGGEETSALNPGLDGLDNIDRALRKAIMEEVGRLGAMLSFLATVGNTAPFIGLFGTVWGIMTSFHSIGLRGSASLAAVAPGISEALVATAAGLFAAIPAVVAYNYYTNRLQVLESETTGFADDLMNLVRRDLLQRQENRSK